MISVNSFKSRLLLSGVLLIIIVCVVVFSARHMINLANEKSLQNLDNMATLQTHLVEIKNNLQDTERLIYQQAIKPELDQEKDFITIVHNIEDTENVIKVFLTRILTVQNGHADIASKLQNMLELITEIEKTTAQLKAYGKDYLTVSQDLNQRVPGRKTLIEKLLPNNNRFIEASDLAIAEINTGISRQQQTEINNIFQSLRYIWAQQISWVRLFIANRSGVFGEATYSMRVSLDNRMLYANQIMEYMRTLGKFEQEGLLDLQQSLSYHEMQDIIVDYENDFKIVKESYMADNWRIDLELLKTNISPLFESIWDNIHAFESALGEYAKSTVDQSKSAANQSSDFVWSIGAVSMIMILLTYYLFNIILRRPIIQIAKALDAEAAGNNAELVIKNSVEETELLLKAFRNMQNQVHQRQTRLESILDNAAEGIITINESGIVETFNAAAQKLFGYSSEEVIGKNIKMLVPVAHRDHHDMYLQNYISSEQQDNIIGIKREVSAQRKNGSIFPMSLKVSEMYLDDLRHYTAVIDDISDRKAIIQNLRNLAEHDSLTGLYNRLYFSEELERVVIKKNRGDQNAVALLYIDLDNFKYVNDTMGHLAGDQLLVEVGSILKSNTRDSDLLARLGGDEFAVILFRPDSAHITDAAERFRASIEDYMFMSNGKSVNIGCSIGVAILDASIQEKDQILSKADIACAEAKKRGRNMVHIFTEEDEDKISAMSSDIGWVNTIKQALQNDRFELAGQPIVATTTGETEFLEVLIRLRGDNNELIMPAGFIPSAERFSLMADIDRWVIKHAFALLEQLTISDPRSRFSINLSANSLDDKNIIDFIKQQISHHTFNPASLLFEVTESIAIANLQSASATLTQLRDLGCKTALDDFGVGYSSFTYLKELPVDYVKIDGSFVRDIDSNNLNLAFVKSMNDIAHAMGKKTIAEFVETQTCLDKLADIGVDYAQGYLLGRPELFEADIHQEALRTKLAG